ncbi:MAG: DUF1553 domain-containing protein [Planctomycetales bacterium]
MNSPAQPTNPIARAAVGRSLLASLAWLAVSFSAPHAFAADPIDAADLEFFETRIRPVLVENCYSCHNSVEEAEGDFALDFRDGIRRMINLKSPGDSKLIKVVRHEIEDLNMPSEGAKLAPKTISDLVRWIKMGAPDPRDAPPTKEQLAQERSWDSTLERRKQWWCFQPIKNSKIPSPKAVAWSEHPVDRFILKKLEDAKLSPAAEADRATLARRLSFALTGLPPTLEQIDAFDRDKSPNAFDKFTDELLGSERFGERWARHWMDWIRFAESHGSEGDPLVPHAYRYRDYLIRALNADVPYDQLVREHVAGDLLPKPRINAEQGINESALGTAHWRMVFHGFAPTDALDEKARFTDDQINAFSKAFLGLTVSCARCHNHKFDAISQADYYALFGILGSTRPSMLDVNTAERQALHQERLTEIKQEIRNVAADRWLAVIEDAGRNLPKLNDAWTKAINSAAKPDHPFHAWRRLREEAKTPDRFAAAWSRIAKQWQDQADAVKQHRDREYAKRWTLGSQNDYDSWFREGNGLPDRAAAAGEFSVSLDGDRIVQNIHPSGAFTHATSTKHRGILASPRYLLDGDYDLWVLAAGDSGAMLRYVVYNYPRRGTVYPVTTLGGGEWKWHKFSLKYWEGDEIHIELTTAADSPVLARGTPRSWFGIREAVLTRRGEPAPATLPEHNSPLSALTSNDAPESLDDLSQAYLQAIKHCVAGWRDGKLNDGEALFLSGVLRAGLLPNNTQDLPAVKKLLEEYRRLEQEIPEPTRVAGLAEADSFDQPLFQRGNHKNPGDPVPRRFLEAIDSTPYKTSQSGRLELARDLLRPDNPLTSRVIVNRLWHHLFGRGIVSTPDNFGRLGDKPTHPELLDYLAHRMADNGWSIKDMIRFLVTSKTWRQVFAASPEARGIDPENRLASHANVRRLEAEAIRDSLLSASGRLDPRMFGGSQNGGAPRRSVYVQVKRNSLDPLLRVFDFPEPFTAVGRRDVTNVPAQSLTMLNDKFVNGLASSWADRVLKDASATTDRQRLDLMYRQAFGRAANDDEAASALGYLAGLQGASAVTVRRINALQAKIAASRKTVNAIIQPVRQRLLAALPDAGQPVELKPIARWEFDKDLKDSVGEAHGTALGGARIESGELVLDGRDARVITKPIKHSLAAKTLEVWVRLSGLDQRGGGAMTVQTPSGQTFDSIVFAERDPKQWMAGSNGFRRTRSFSGPMETTDAEPVHIAIVYRADGRIIGYRNGKPYGSPYQSVGLQKFAAGGTVAAFGVRHSPAARGRMLAGRILRDQLHDRALSSEEVAASASGSGKFVSTSQVLASLSAKDRKAVGDAEQAIVTLDRELKTLGPIPRAGNPRAAWTDLAHALFNFKEFIYLR